MTASFFTVPETLIANRPQAAALNRNTSISNFLLENPKPKIPKTNSTLNQKQIQLLVSAIDQHYKNASANARVWLYGHPETSQSSLKDQIVDFFSEFNRFQDHISIEYKKIVEDAYYKKERDLKEQLQRVQRIVSEASSKTRGTSESVKNYEKELQAAQKNFQSDEEKIEKEVGEISDVTKELKSRIKALHQKISQNDSDVLKTFLETGGKEIEQGALLFTSAATEDYGTAVVAGVTMGVAYGEGLAKVIQLNESTLHDIEKIRNLSMKVNADNVVMTELTNIGTMLVNLGGAEGFDLRIVHEIADYWDNMASGIDRLLQQHDGNLSDQIDTTNFSPSNEGQRDPAFPPWNVIIPIERTSQVFQRFLTMQPTTFDNNTKFGGLQENGA